MITTLPLLFASTLLLQGNPAGSPLTGVERTAHFEIHFRPGSRAEASADRVAVVAEEDLAKILRELEMKEFKKTIRLYLYDDVPELQKITGSPSAGYSITLESHVPHDNDQTRLHELVHVVAEQFNEKGFEARNMFAAEGLANAVLRFVHGVSVDAVAAYYKNHKELPPLAELLETQDFYAWLKAHPGIDGYDIGGSFFRFLLDKYGAAKVRQYYKGAPFKESFGADVTTVEKAWHARLDKFQIRPGVEDLLKERFHPPTPAEKNPREAKLNDTILGPASAWKDLSGAALAAGAPGAWEAPNHKSLLLTGVKSEGDWCVVAIGNDNVSDAIVRCRAEALDSCYGVQLQLGPKCQALLLRGQGCFIYNEASGVAFNPKIQLADKPVEIVLRRVSGRASVWIDGVLAAEADIDPAAAAPGVGSVGGKARFSQIAIRKLQK
ncbi:MAG: hypothetical protein HY286_12400 [Planctomycetes bacterium]|nr:hypothetical protein [Planctomycetota bacterium]